MSRALGWVLLVVPLLVALGGPLVAGSVDPVGAPSAPPRAGHPLGTDVLGRDVLAVVLSGGLSVVGFTAAALGLAYGVGVPVGLVAAGQRRVVDEVLMRGLDLVLAFPSLLVLMVLAATGHRGAVVLVFTAAAVQVPAVVRVVRAAALAPGCRVAVEALYLQGQSWWRIHVGYVARSALGPVATDAGTRVALVLGLVASANFLGLGLPSGSVDWAVVIDRNSDALDAQPAVVLVPSALLVGLCVGANLVADSVLGRGRRTG
ncbi:ABC transporter permease [Actinokineospora spheciospongiae]|uniref:ABC transporter permease n=1 Tax=Actinokineospora spheciospongiae TaxID=909613 RepID=UPI000D8E6AC4|nr:ABC transporter permease subunit [Actinokineospora spheciospongiae]PWW66803.1 peptide/nickel transport system permease protein [Actinokineospora spheciospongiae]